MPMKNFTFFFNLLLCSIFLLSTNLIYGQNKVEPVCGTIATPESIAYLKSIKPQLEKYEQEYFKLASLQNRSATPINSIPIKAHIIRTSAGTGGLSVSDLNNAMDNMNAFYANAFMEFFLCDGINYIDDDNFYDFETDDEGSLTSANNVSGLINIYFSDFVKSSGNGVSLCGYAYSPGGADVILMKNTCATNGSTLPHEVGHFFSLIHTHGSSNTFLTKELVDGSNCDIEGDLICDTPADPQLSSSNVNVTCIYTGTTTDANGDTFAPNPNNIMSYSRKECRTYFSPQQFARIYATFQNTRNNFSCPSLNIDFAVDNTQDCDNSLTVNFTDNSVGATSWQWDIDSDMNIDYTTQNPSHTFSQGTYDVTLTISDGANTITKTYNQLINVGPQKTTPMSEGFDNFNASSDDGWVSNDVTGNGYNWIADSGGTPSDDTGPLVDNTYGTAYGTYIYAEASGVNLESGNIATYISPCVAINSATAQLEFSYHMFGISIGELHVDIETDFGIITDIMPVLDGPQQDNQTDNYIRKFIDISSFSGQTIKIHFRAIRGSNWDADIAIDDVAISENLLSTTSNNLLGMKIYPNPVSNNVINIKTNNLGIQSHYKIANLFGQEILKGRLIKEQINVSNLASGTYFLILRQENSKLIKKFIKL